MTQQNPAIHIENVAKTYGRIHALRDLTLTVQPGEIFGLVGANGAGKTTLLKILIGILRPDAGRGRVLGLDPQTDAHRLRPQIGYMPQESALYEDLTARENVRFFAAGHRLPSANVAAADVLAFVDLTGRQRDLAHTFSGGMKQRLSLACALVHRPRLLLLDEPSTGVDPKLRESMWAHFRQLTAEGATILVSTHQMDEVLHCARAAIMRDGRVLRQLAHDRRFLALSLVVPILIIAMVWVFFDAVDNPFFDVTGFIPPVSGYIVHFLTYVLSAIVLVRERTAGTLPRMFVGGFRRGSIIAGYVLAHTALGALQTFIVLAMTKPPLRPRLRPRHLAPPLPRLLAPRGHQHQPRHPRLQLRPQRRPGPPLHPPRPHLVRLPLRHGRRRRPPP